DIWAGTDGGGLERLRPRIIELLGRDSGLPNVSVRTTCEDASGTIWVTTQNGLLVRRTNGRWETFEKGSNSVDGFISCVAAASDGGIWIGTTDNGFFYWNAGRYRHWNHRNGLSSDEVRAILQSSSGDVFISTDIPSRLHRLHDGQLQKLSMPFPHRSLRALVEDTAGNIWIGSADGVLMRVKGNIVVDETPPSKRLLSIRCLYPAPDGSLLIGYAAWGIGRLQGTNFFRLTSDQGLYDDYVSQMVADPSGWLWCAGNRGVFRISLARFNAVAEGRSARIRSIAYGPAEGANLQPNYENGSTAFRSPQGQLYFPMRTGLAIVHTENVPHDAPPPPVIVERVAVDDQTVALYDRRLGLGSSDPQAVNLGETPSNLRVSPNHRTLEFDFTALSFASPEDVQFQYRLENFEDDWTEAGTERHADFPRPPPGRYRFDVRACNSDGIWSAETAAVDFVVTPFYWQTWWFRSTALLVFTLSLIAIVRYVSFRRLRRQLAALEQQAALQRERTRIAKDIHDDLGANLTQIAFLGELAQQDRGEPDKAVERVEKISATARQAIKSLDEIVWAVNPRNDTLAHLTDYAGQFALDYLRLAGIRCRLDLPEQCPTRDLTTDLRHNLFLAIKEALHNIVKHAHATEVRLQIQCSGDSLDIVIEDNGCGFDPALAHNGAAGDPLADGLRNMRQRMTDIGGQFDFQTAAGRGTTVHLRLSLEKESV
ncbi:MAG TPA: two-component regulator propeller domain-containing protein, partial [Verrucomicrobiae bacterium]|nr:two-component regulator propeller domain-containing protein [Verrucomicrobiae bacterium]